MSTHAPGRVNLIGEHTDYNGGFVLPAALSLGTTVELTRTNGSAARVWSAQFPSDGPVTFTVGRETAGGGWGDYVKGMTWALAADGALGGFDARIASDLPVGSGLSSSAALLIALARALREAFQLSLDDVTLALRARRAEVEFVGAPVGIMDQMACSLADAESGLFLDTRTLAYERIPIPPSAALIVIDSGVAHRHAAGAYRERREECARAAALLGAAELRDVEDVDRVAALPAPLARRARHVVTENARVLSAVAALRMGQLEEVGRLFVASHASMRDDFEISVPAVDALVETACEVSGVYGARMTGGGFGGAVVALAVREQASAAASDIVARHQARGHSGARVIVPTT
jgi:galactokinase